MCQLKENIAVSYGINAGIIAQFLWENINVKNKSVKRIFFKDEIWFRCSIKTMTGVMPYLTKSQITDAVHILIDNGVIRKDCFNMNKFDKTSWYTFTGYGRLLMQKKDHEIRML